jgi:hypothetical protein
MVKSEIVFLETLDISIGKQGTGPPWKGTEVWNNLLEPFSPWIRREC